MASNNTVEIQVTADTAQAQVGLGNVNKGLAETGASAAALQGKAVAAGQGLNQTAGAAGKTTEALDKTAKSATATGTAFGGIGALIAGAFTGRELVQTITQADSLQRGMAAVAGSSKAAADEMAFVKRISNELGLEINSTGQAYLQLTAATKGTAIEGQATRDVFTSVSRAMSALGKSTAETENALRAVSQIASKGTVSMEELRGQLGEALPGALKAAADGLKVTVPELIKMVESGGVLAKDLLPALSKSLDDLYAGGGSPDTLVAQFNRFKNAVSAVAVELGESGLTKALGDAAVGGAKVAGLLGSAFVGLGKGIGNVAGAVATLDFKPLADDLGLTGRAAQDFSELTYDAMGNLIGSTQQAIPPVQELKQKLEAAAVAAGKLGLVATDFGNESKSAFRKAEIAAQNAEAVLRQAAKNSVAAFDKFKESGDSAAEAVAKIGKDFDLSTAPGIRDAANVLNQLVAQGKITADQFNKTWTDALKGVDLTEFAGKAKKAFEDTNQSAAVLAGVLNQGVREAIKRTGLDFDVISGGMGKAARSAINDTTAIIAGLDGLKKQGVDTAAVLTASIGKAIATADSQKAIEAVRLQIESLRKTLGDKVTDGLLDQAKTKALELADASDKAKLGVNSLREAMKELGLTSREELQATAKRAQEAYDVIKTKGQEEGESYVAWQARKGDAARVMLQRLIAANNGVADSSAVALAAMEGLTIVVDAAGRATVQAMNAGADAAGRLGDAAARAGDATQSAAERAIEALERETAAIERAADAQRRRANIDKEGFSTDKEGKRIVGQEGDDAFKKRVGDKYGEKYGDDKNAGKALSLQQRIDEIRRAGNSGPNNSEVTRLLKEQAEAEVALLKTQGEDKQKDAEEKAKENEKAQKEREDAAKRRQYAATKQADAQGADIAASTSYRDSQLVVKKAVLAAQLSKNAADLELAKTTEDLAAQTRLLEQAKRLELEKLRLDVETVRQQADALRDQAAALELRDRALGGENIARLTEIRALRQRALAKDVEAESLSAKADAAGKTVTASPSPIPAPAPTDEPSTRLPIRTVNINLTGAGGTETVPTTEAGAAALLRVLQNARLSA